MKSLRIIVFIILACNAIQAQTSITVIGTMHNPTPKVDANKILEAIKKVDPDVILIEFDSSIMDSTGKMLIDVKSNETTAFKEFIKIKDIPVRPFDYKFRNKFYRENNTFRNEEKFSKRIDSLYRANAIDEASKWFYQTYSKMNFTLRYFDNADLATINSASTSAVMELRQDMMYNGLLKIAERTPAMADMVKFWKENGDFWNFRNGEMTKNIIRYANEFKDKKVVVLVGYYHKYALIKNLKKEMADNNYLLKDFWEF